MRHTRLLSLALALAASLFALPPVAHAQATTTITATLVDAGNGPVTGTLCLHAVNSYDNPISISKAGGGFYLANRPFCQTLTAGALVGSLTVPNPVTDSAPGHAYDIVVYDTTSSIQTDLGPVYGIGGSSWSLDNYNPTVTVPTTAAFTFTQGSGVPSGICTAPAIYINTAVGSIYVCAAGAWELAAGAGGAVNSLTTAGSGAATLIGGVLNIPTPTGGGIPVDTSGTSMYNSSSNPTSPGLSNVVIGVSAGSHLTVGGTAPNYGGQLNVVIGHDAGAALTTARESVVIGERALANYTGVTDGATPEDGLFVAIGSSACLGVTGGIDVMCIGQKSLGQGGGSGITANRDIYIGNHTGIITTSSEENVVIGQFAANPAGSYTNTLEQNVFIGDDILAGSLGGDYQKNTGVGSNAFSSLMGGAIGNTAVGAYAGGNLSTGTYNICIGDHACAYGGGATPTVTGSYNVVLGAATASNMTSASNNFVVGMAYGAVESNLSTGSQNILMSRYGRISSGSNNIIIGVNAGNGMSGTETYDTALGDNATFLSGVSDSIQLGEGTCGTSSTLCFGGQYSGEGGPAYQLANVSTGRMLDGNFDVPVVVGYHQVAGLYGYPAPGASSHYADLSFNGSLTDASEVGLRGGNADSGNDPVLYHFAATGGSHQFEVGGTVVALITPTGFHENLTTPSSSSATCSAGDFTDDASYHYTCTATNTWKRVALSTF
jgi:hypothetical protein